MVESGIFIFLGKQFLLFIEFKVNDPKKICEVQSKGESRVSPGGVTVGPVTSIGRYKGSDIVIKIQIVFKKKFLYNCHKNYKTCIKIRKLFILGRLE
jgi:hypothetical protein